MWFRNPCLYSCSENSSSSILELCVDRACESAAVQSQAAHRSCALYTFPADTSRKHGGKKCSPFFTGYINLFRIKCAVLVMAVRHPTNRSGIKLRLRPRRGEVLGQSLLWGGDLTSTQRILMQGKRQPVCALIKNKQFPLL